jgi:transglutaminase-like putative cysteine protease
MENIGNAESFVSKWSESEVKSTKMEAKPEDLASSELIRLDDPLLQELAANVDDSLTPRQTALALEKLVHATIQQTSFSIAFASSSDVLKSKRGDCTEFAVLLTALCRTKKIPARVVLGLVYAPFRPMESQQNSDKNISNENNSDNAEAGMLFHLWNEVLIDGIWQPLDAVLALGGADAARIKIADDNLAGNSITPLCNSLLGIIGRIRIYLPESYSQNRIEKNRKSLF